jgi:FkbM family methyltransferase
MYYSQWGQDRWLEENIFKGKRQGIFVEIGVLNGISDSNTAFFEFERNWTGLLVEANPQFARDVPLNRPNSKFKHCAAYSKKGSVSFKVVEHTPGWSGIEQDFDPFHASRINKGGMSHYVTVPCDTLENLLADLHNIDYMSVDIEGAELAILKDFPFKQFDIRIIGVENNVITDRRVEHVLFANGYQFLHRIEYDDFYQRNT